jgi:hypothetical protein
LDVAFSFYFTRYNMLNHPKYYLQQLVVELDVLTYFDRLALLFNIMRRHFALRLQLLASFLTLQKDLFELINLLSLHLVKHFKMPTLNMVLSLFLMLP